VGHRVKWFFVGQKRQLQPLWSSAKNHIN